LDVDEIYSIIKFAINKSQSGYVSPEEFNRVINVAQKSWCTYLLGTLQQYTPGRPVALVELGQNSVVRQRLTPVIYGYNLSVDANGYSGYPGDYLQTDAMWSIYGFSRIRFVQQDSLHSYYNSTIDPIATNPIYLIKDIGFQFYPTTIANAKLSYVRNPPNMVWGYIDDPDRPGEVIYSEIHSTQPVWDYASMLEIIVRALAIIGVNLQLPVVSQYAEQIKKTGQ
jgi:hypothetical protein